MTLEQVLNRLRTKKRWFEKSYSGFLFPISVQGTGVANGEKISTYAIPYGLVFQNHNKFEHWDWFWDEEFMVEKRKKILAAAKTDKSFSQNFYNAWKKTYDDFLNYWEQIKYTDFGKLNVDEIRSIIKPLYQKVAQQASYGYIVDTFLNNEEQDWLEKEIKDELSNKANSEVIATLTTPVYESFVNDFEAAKIKIAQKRSLTLAEKLAKEYFWIRTNYQVYAAITAKEIYEEALQESGKHKAPSAADNRRKKEALMKKLKVSEKLRRVLNVSETFTHIQDKRKEVVLRSNYIFFRGLEAVEKKLKIERKLIFYLLPEEFVQKEQFANIDWQEIRDRRDKGVLVVNCDGRCHPIPRKQYEKELPLKNFYKAFDEVKEVKGSVAYKGLVRGVAKVLYNVKEIQEFKTGEILIANQTTPEYVPAMKKAAAFVTDQGGITCHAAIVAREMKKPCVIGAKAATKIFKSGDMVEVDANKGIVRKI